MSMFIACIHPDKPTIIGIYLNNFDDDAEDIIEGFRDCLIEQNEMELCRFRWGTIVRTHPDYFDGASMCFTTERKANRALDIWLNFRDVITGLPLLEIGSEDK